MNSEDTKRWPAMRWQVVRQAGLAVLWRGPLLGLFLAVLLMGGAAGISYRVEGQTLDFGCFQVAGRQGAPVFPVLSRLWRFALLTVLFNTAFLGLVGAAAIVTTELAYRRARNTPGGGS